MNPNSQTLPAKDEPATATPFDSPEYTGIAPLVPNPQTGAGLPGPVRPPQEDDFVARLPMIFGAASLSQQISSTRYHTLALYNYTAASVLTVYIGAVDPANVLAIVSAGFWKALPIPSGTAVLWVVASAADVAANVALLCAQRMAPFSGAV